MRCRSAIRSDAMCLARRQQPRFRSGPFTALVSQRTGHRHGIAHAGLVRTRGSARVRAGIQLLERAKLVHQIKTEIPAGIEAYLHRRFANQQKNGQWFELTGMMSAPSGDASSCGGSWRMRSA